MAVFGLCRFAALLAVFLGFFRMFRAVFFGFFSVVLAVFCRAFVLLDLSIFYLLACLGSIAFH